MGFTIIAPVGDNTQALFVGMKQFPTERVILLAPKSNSKLAQGLAEQLKTFTIKTDIIDIENNIMEEMFRVFGQLCSIYPPDDLIVNVATGDRMSTCAALSAAFANGLKAFGVVGDQCMLMPIMKLSYYNELSDNKMKILKKLSAQNYVTLKELNKKVGMSVSLLSYHLNGNYNYKGLKEFRLVELKEHNKNLLVKLSSLGHLLLKGYIKTKKEAEQK